MLKVALEKGTKLIKCPFEVESTHCILATTLTIVVKLSNFLKQKFIFLFLSLPDFEKILLEVFSKVGSPNETLQHCVHIASIS